MFRSIWTRRGCWAEWTRPFLFPSFNSIDCNPHGFCSDAYPKKACTYCKSVPLCEFVCMHAQNFVYMRAFACFFALMCVVFCRLVAYHDVTAVCMYVPVWGHHTNTMNVDIVKSFILFYFFLQRSLRSCHWKPKNGLMWLCFWVSRQIKYMATINNLLIMGLFWPFWISSQTEIKPAWTI